LLLQLESISATPEGRNFLPREAENWPGGGFMPAKAPMPKRFVKFFCRIIRHIVSIVVRSTPIRNRRSKAAHRLAATAHDDRERK